MNNFQDIAFGCGRLRSGLERRNSFRLIESAIDLGINCFDLAPSYGDGQAHKIIGSILSSDRAKFVYRTKVGFVGVAPSLIDAYLRPILRYGYKKYLPSRQINSSGLDVSALSDYPVSRPDLSLSFVRDSIVRSLEDLKTDYIDECLLHEPAANFFSPEIDQHFNELISKGTLKRVGVGTGRFFDNLPDFGSIRQALYRGSVIRGNEDLDIWVHGIARYPINAFDFHPDVRDAIGYELTSHFESLDNISRAIFYVHLLRRYRGVKGVVYSTTSVSNLSNFIDAWARSTVEIASFSDNLLLILLEALESSVAKR